MATEHFAKMLKRLFVCAALALVSAVSVFAVTPHEYHETIKSAVESVRRLEHLQRDSEEERKMIADILSSVPAKERVEWPGSVVETDNGWLAEKMAAYQKAGDSERSLLIAELTEQLSAIAMEAERLVNATAAGPAKDADKQKLSEILSRPEYQPAKETSQSLFRQWLERFVNWIASLFPSGPAMPAGDAGFGNITFWLQILLITLIVGLIGFLIYKFAPAVFPTLRRGKSAKGDRVILGERVAADEDSAGLLEEAERLAREGNLRAAIRKGYVALLCELSDRNLIGLAGHKTNRDYIRDLRKNAGLQKDVRGLTDKFELHWYGERPAGDSDWEEFRNTYRRVVDN